jgi:hypothetical protein
MNGELERNYKKMVMSSITSLKCFRRERGKSRENSVCKACTPFESPIDNISEISKERGREREENHEKTLPVKPVLHLRVRSIISLKFLRREGERERGKSRENSACKACTPFESPIDNISEMFQERARKITRNLCL